MESGALNAQTEDNWIKAENCGTTVNELKGCSQFQCLYFKKKTEEVKRVWHKQGSLEILLAEKDQTNLECLLKKKKKKKQPSEVSHSQQPNTYTG